MLKLEAGCLTSATAAVLKNRTNFRPAKLLDFTRFQRTYPVYELGKGSPRVQCGT
jgi:hypothetical protein